MRRTGPQVRHGPARRGFGDQPGQLAERPLPRQPRHASSPCVKARRMVADRRLHGVVDHHPQAGVAVEQAGEVLKMLRTAQRVEGQSHLRQRVETPGCARAQHPVRVGDVLDHRAHAAKLRMLCKALQRAPVGGVVEIHPADHRRHAVGLVRDPQQIPGLRHGRRRLHQHRRAHPRRRQRGREVGGAVGARQHRIILRHPAVIAARGVPVVLVRVDHFFAMGDHFFAIGVGASSRISSSRFSSAQSSTGIRASRIRALARTSAAL